jgi:hypothetical protein
MAFADKQSTSYSYSSSSSISSSGGVSVSVVNGIATIKLPDGRTWQLPATQGRVSTSTINEKAVITIDGQSWEIPETGNELIPVTTQIINPQVALNKIQENLKVIASYPNVEPQAVQKAVQNISEIQNALDTQGTGAAVLDKGAGVIFIPNSNIQPVPIPEVPAVTQPVTQPISKAVTQPIPQEAVKTQLQAEQVQPEQAGMLPDTIFGIKTSYLLIGAGLIGLLFIKPQKIQKRKYQRRK